MTKEEYLQLAAKRYDKIASLKEEKSFLEYEKQFDHLWTEMGRDVLEHSIGEVPRDKRKKTSFARGSEK
jgi:hypothetical protein